MMASSLSLYKQLLLTAFCYNVLCVLTAASDDIQCLNETLQGKIKSYKNSIGVDAFAICLKDNGVYRWKSIDGSVTIGEKFDPARDCSDIVENRPEARDGFYWIAVREGEARKAWCDVHTDGGGFMLVGNQNSSDIWTVPSSLTPVDPHGPAQISSSFGKFNVEDFAVQVSTSESFKDTKAHWFYRLNSKRELGDLFGIGNGFCTELHSGIGNISYVKDILTGSIVTKNFKCSKFGPHSTAAFGWVRMNHCLKHDCPKGYAFIEGFPYQLDTFGSLSYSAISSMSGMTHSSTAFVGCENNKCCACYGPKGGRKDYCGKRCTAINGGTVTEQAHVWFWIRTRTPKRVWKRCMEFQKKRDDGKIETYFVDKKTDVANKTLRVKDAESFGKIPSVPGLLTYREDEERLYVNSGSQWNALSTEISVLGLVEKLRRRIEYLENKMPSVDQVEKKVNYLEKQLLPGCKNSRALGMQSGAIPNHMLAASSLSLNNYGTNYARLNGPRGWVPRYSNRNLYLIVDFGRHTIVTGISTQGRQDANQYVNGYTISVFGPETRGRYVSYKVGGIAKVFHGNSDHNSIVQNLIVPSFVARAIRIHPTGWIGRIAMRVELYGCRA